MRLGPAAGFFGDTYQIIDLAPHAAAIDAGKASVSFGAWFNTSAPSAGAEVGVTLFMLNNLPLNFTEFSSSNRLGDPTGLVSSSSVVWEQYGFSDLALSAGTRYAAFGVHGALPSANSLSSIFVDDAFVTLTIDNANDNANKVPLPGTLGLVAAGMFLLRRRLMR